MNKKGTKIEFDVVSLSNRIEKDICVHVSNVNQQNRTKLPPYLFEVAIGNRLGDRSLYSTKTKGSKMKLEQGRVHKDYLYHLFFLYKGWTNYKEPYRYVPKVTKGTYTRGVVKSYRFRTIRSPAFNEIYDLFIVNGKKTYKEG